MSRKVFFIMIAILTLASVTLACSLFSGGDESATVAPVDDSAPAEDVSPEEGEEAEDQPAPADQPDEPQPAPDANLGDEYRSVGGGYAYQPIPDYTLEEVFGISILKAPDADPDLGPLIMLIGGTNEEEMSIEQMLAGPTGEMDAGTEILDQREITVDGYPAEQADFKGIQFEQEAMGRVVIVAISPTQQFIMFGSAPSDRWEDVGPLFDAMLASVYFFEPEEIDFTDMLEGDDPEDDSLDTVASDLLPGEFEFTIISDDGTFVFVENGSIQDQSTTSEYVIGLVSQDERHTVTLFMPHELSDMLMITPYDSSSLTHGPGSAIYVGFTLYTANDGFFVFDEITDDTVTGTFFFNAANQDDPNDIIQVAGSFSELPLGNQ